MLREVLRLLTQSGYVSGERISSLLGISRTAVWKKINILRAAGFDIQAIPARGYCLASAPDLSADEIFARVGGDFWRDIRYYPSVVSTNDAASADVGIASGTIVLADGQTGGRGRLGRQWLSPPGRNIYMSIFLTPDLPPRDAPLLTLVAAAAGAAALRELAALPVSVKWPNDLQVTGRKIGGILTEVRSDPDRIYQAIIGIGINVHMESDNLPEEIRELATSVRIAGGAAVRRSELIVRLLEEFERRYRLLQSEGRQPLLHEMRGLLSTIGRQVTVHNGSTRTVGTAVDIDDEGMLVLRLLSGELRKVTAGDVTVHA